MAILAKINPSKTMSENCKNCSEIITGNFCSQCGQKKYKRIDKSYIWEELQYTILHTNKGFLYSLKNILKNPGKTAREFIDGKRIRHYKPILMTFVLSGIATFLTYKVLGFAEIMSAFYRERNIGAKATADIMSFFSSYSTLIMLMLIPFFALTTKIAFKKWGHNYYEHIVMNAYILSYYTIISIIIVYPIMFFFKHSSPATMMAITFYSLFLIPLILVWFFKEFYKEKPVKAVILKVLAVLGLVILGYIILLLIVVILFMLVTMQKAPETLQYIPKTK